MLDWRILAASFVALIVIVVGLAGNLKVPESLADLANPFSFIGSLPLAGESEIVTVTFYPEGSYKIEPQGAVNISAEGLVLSDFRGSITADFAGGKVILDEADSSLNLELGMRDVAIDGLRLGKASLAGVRLAVATGNWNYTSANGTVEFTGFLGTGAIGTDSITLNGNATGFSKK